MNTMKFKGNMLPSLLHIAAMNIASMILCWLCRIDTCMTLCMLYLIGGHGEGSQSMAVSESQSIEVEPRSKHPFMMRERSSSSATPISITDILYLNMADLLILSIQNIVEAHQIHLHQFQPCNISHVRNK